MTYLEPHYSDAAVTLFHGDAAAVLATLPDNSIDCCVTSPPYLGLRNYGSEDQIGTEPTLEAYVARLVDVFTQVRRVLTPAGGLWLNLGDTYANKTLLGVPWRVAFALADSGWVLRNEVIWSKTTGVPFAGTDRFANRHETVFFFTKSKRRYTFNDDDVAVPTQTEGRPQRARAEQLAAQHGLTDEHLAAIRACGLSDVGKVAAVQSGTGRNTARQQALAAEAKAVLGSYYREFLTRPTKMPGDVWEIAPEPFPQAHTATFPSDLPRRCITAGCVPGGVVLDPFSGSGTTGAAALSLGREYVGIDLSAEYLDMSLRTRFAQTALDLRPAA